MTEMKAAESRKVRPGEYVPDALRHKAAMLFSRGVSFRTAAQVLDLSENTMRDWHRLWKLGKFQEVIAVKHFRWDDATRAKVLEMRRNGRTWREVFQETGVKAPTAYRWIQAEKKRYESENNKNN